MTYVVVFNVIQKFAYTLLKKMNFWLQEVFGLHSYEDI